MITEQMKSLLKHYNEGLQLYKDMKFKEALSSFQKGLEIIPDDGPSRMYITRCEEFIKEPPPADWDGVYVMKTK
ncbi:MAG: tetratricopeptide repeat protein [Leptospiraceae bacterium]|nr:tetratricopeptide repeat protein [Leptospiraceae bacterium]